MQDKILEIGGDKLRAQKSKVDQIKDQIALTNEQITKTQVAKSKAEKDMTKFENSLAKNEGELEELNDGIEKLTEEIQQKTEVARSIHIKADEAKSVSFGPIFNSLNFHIQTKPIVVNLVIVNINQFFLYNLLFNRSCDEKKGKKMHN